MKQLIQAKNEEAKYDEMADISQHNQRSLQQQKPADYGEYPSARNLKNISNRNNVAGGSLQPAPASPNIQNLKAPSNSESCNTTISFSNYIRKFKDTDSCIADSNQKQTVQTIQETEAKAPTSTINANSNSFTQPQRRGLAKRMNIEISIDEKYENFHNKSQEKSLLQDDLVLHMSPKLEINAGAAKINDTFENFLKYNHKEEGEEDEEEEEEPCSESLRLEILGKGGATRGGSGSQNAQPNYQQHQLEVSFQQEDTVSEEREQSNIQTTNSDKNNNSAENLSKLNANSQNENQNMSKSYKEELYANLETLNMKKSISLETGIRGAAGRLSQGFNESLLSNRESNRHSRNISYIPHSNSITQMPSRASRNHRSSTGLNQEVEEGLSEIRNTVSTSSEASEIYSDDIKTSSDEEEPGSYISSDSQEKMQAGRMRRRRRENQKANAEDEEEEEEEDERDYNNEKSLKNNLSRRFNYNTDRSISKIKTFHLDNNSFSGEIIDEDEEQGSAERHGSGANAWAQQGTELSEQREENKDDNSLSKSMLSAADLTPNTQNSLVMKSLNHSKTASFQRNQTNEKKRANNPSTKRFLVVSSQDEAIQLSKQQRGLSSSGEEGLDLVEDDLDPRNIRRAVSKENKQREQKERALISPEILDPLLQHLHKKNQNSMAVQSQQLFFEELTLLSARRSGANTQSQYNPLNNMRNIDRDSSFQNDLSALKNNKSFLDNNKSFLEQTSNNINHKNSMISLGMIFDFW